jgi:hypothetical protein
MMRPLPCRYEVFYPCCACVHFGFSLSAYQGTPSRRAERRAIMHGLQALSAAAAEAGHFVVPNGTNKFVP